MYIYTTTYIQPHHHTVQVANCALCTLVPKCLDSRGETPPVQVAVGGGSMASHVCTLVNVLVGAIKTPPAQVADDVHCKWK